MLRYIARISVLICLAALILYNGYAGLKSRYGGQDQIQASPVYSLIDRIRGSSPHLEEYQRPICGNLWSVAIGDFRISDPLAVFSAPAALWHSALIPVLLTLLLGRVYCGWLCPMGLFSDLVTKFRRLARRFGILFFSLPVTGKLKYVVLLTGAAFVLFTSSPFFFHIYPPRIISDLLRDLLGGEVTYYGVVFLSVVLLLELLFVERLWCRCLCPGGALFSLLSRFRLLRIKRDEMSCIDCLDCDVACPHELSPSHLFLSGECDNCGLCRKSCSTKALRYSLCSSGKDCLNE